MAEATIGQDPGFDPAHIQRTFDRLLGDDRVGRQIACSLQRGDQEDHGNRYKRHPVEIETVFERHRHADQRYLGHVGEVHLAGEPGHAEAQHQADDHGRQAYDLRREAVENHDGDQHQAAEAQVVQGAEIRRAVAASDIGHGHLDQ